MEFDFSALTNVLERKDVSLLISYAGNHNNVDRIDSADIKIFPNNIIIIIHSNKSGLEIISDMKNVTIFEKRKTK